VRGAHAASTRRLDKALTRTSIPLRSGVENRDYLLRLLTELLSHPSEYDFRAVDLSKG
jgi:hypothetical protein